jgi:hypothetical protein
MSAKKGRTFLWLALSLALIVLFIGAPFIALAISGGVADLLGCTLPISALASCPFMGVDLGDTLTIMAYLGYFGFVTVPLAGPLLAIWFVVACITVAVSLLRRGRKSEA